MKNDRIAGSISPDAQNERRLHACDFNRIGVPHKRPVPAIFGLLTCRFTGVQRREPGPVIRASTRRKRLGRATSDIIHSENGEMAERLKAAVC